MIVLDYIKDYSLVLLGKTEHFEWDEVSLFILPGHIIGMLLAPLTFWIYNHNKHHDFRKIWKYYICYSLLIGLLFGFFIRTWWMIHSFIFDDVIQEATILDTINKYYKFLIPSSFQGIVQFWAVTILLFALDFYDQFKSQTYRSLQLEAQLNDTKLQNLRMQLNPHFLFNALNTVSMMVRKDKKSEAINMISGLSDLLRSTLNISDDHFITLEEEIELLKKYLKIQEQRFNDRLTVEFDLDEGTLPFKIPNLLLQPLVENAFKFGVSENIDEAYIKILSQKKEGNLHLTIYNKGRVLPVPYEEGIGLKNTKSRLQMSYPRYAFTLSNAIDLSGVEATITIPIEYD